MSTPIADDASHRALHTLFTEVIKAEVGVFERPVWKRDEKQSREMVKDANTLLRSLVHRPEIVASSRNTWRAMERVLSRAMAVGGAYDIAERGVWFVAVRNRMEDTAETEAKRLLAGLGDLGCNPTWPIITTGDLARHDRLACIVPPVALWPQPRLLRERLLCGELYLACIMAEGLWVDAFRAEDLSLHHDERGWAISGGKEVIRFDPLERSKLLAGVAFAGVSPRGIAQAVREASG